MFDVFTLFASHVAPAGPIMTELCRFLRICA
ncbi:hypothetical protein SAMN04487788_1364 [Microbacterium testaceum StLB037]|uniref:Uncharacterized protein n=1 Tax=Microbacterium testaceum (strain StLB037) TaxID=979556 RepID=A0A1H0NIT3_MICTS|nr:hypothetical protein SAMN04487788_1364 [Microbacterium testaceum StLB037]